MKLTKEKLQQIIKEELETFVSEEAEGSAHAGVRDLLKNAYKMAKVMHPSRKDIVSDGFRERMIQAISDGAFGGVGPVDRKDVEEIEREVYKKMHGDSLEEELENLINEEDLGEKYPNEFEHAKFLIKQMGFEKAAFYLRSDFEGDLSGKPTKWNKEKGLGPLPYGDIEPLLRAAEKEVEAERPAPKPPRKRTPEEEKELRKAQDRGMRAYYASKPPGGYTGD